MSIETDSLHKPFMKWLDDCGIKYRRISPKNHYRDTSDGIPDFEVFIHTNPLFIEFKTEAKYKLKDNNLSTNQIKWIDYLTAHDYKVLVTCDLKEAIIFVQEYK
jgi:hypothetical protein